MGVEPIFHDMDALLMTIGMVVFVALIAGLIAMFRLLYLASEPVRQERRLDPRDVREMNQLFARVQRDAYWND